MADSFMIITPDELTGSPLWDHDKDTKEYNKVNLQYQAILMASTEINFICGSHLDDIWDDVQKDERGLKKLKDATVLQTLTILRNGTEYSKYGQSFSAGSVSLNWTNPSDPLYMNPDAMMLVSDSGYMVKTYSANIYDGLHNNLIGMGVQDKTPQWQKEADVRYVNRTGIYSSDSTINVDNQPDADNQSKQVDLTVNFNNPALKDNIASAVAENKDIKYVKGEVNKKANQTDLDTTNKNVSTNATDIKTLQTTKQDTLTPDNAGYNIKITKGDKDQVVISAVVDTDNIKVDGDKITITIDNELTNLKDQVQDNTDLTHKIKYTDLYQKELLDTIQNIITNGVEKDLVLLEDKVVNLFSLLGQNGDLKTEAKDTIVNAINELVANITTNIDNINANKQAIGNNTTKINKNTSDISLNKSAIDTKADKFDTTEWNITYDDKTSETVKVIKNGTTK